MAKTKPMAADAAEKKKSKGKKKGKNAPAKVAIKARGAVAAERSNPFEAIWSRRKFDVLGKKRKGEEQRISRSRSEAIRKVDN
jgi:nucleolar protein 14